MRRGWGIVSISQIPLWPLGSRQSCCWDWAGLKFCQLASISLVCQPYNSQPLTLPQPLVAWITSLPWWRLVAREVQLRDSGDSNLACDAAVSQKDGAPITNANLGWDVLAFLSAPFHPSRYLLLSLLLCSFVDNTVDNNNSSSTICYLLILGLSVHFPSLSLQGTKCLHPSLS